MKKQLLSLSLILLLCFNMIPCTAWAGESEFIIEDGVLTDYFGPGGDVVIPDGVIVIGELAFGKTTSKYNKSSLTSVTIPSSVKYIGKYAFYYSGLQRVNFSEGLDYIDKFAFAGCTSLDQVALPEGLNYIPESSFENCHNMTTLTVSSSVKYIDSGAFRDCSALSKVTIPDTVMIDRNAFYGCDNLPEKYQPRYITHENDDITSDGFWIDGDGVLSKYTGKGGDIVIPSNVTKIEDEAFLGCTSITGVTVPDSVVFIGRDTFSGCENLEKVTLGSGLVYLTETVFGGNFTRNSTCIGCPNLKEIRFPALEKQKPALRYIDNHTFRYSPKLEKILNCPDPDVVIREATNERILDAWSKANPNEAITPQSERITALADQICTALSSDYAKVKAVFNWMTENIEYDYEYYYHRKKDVTVMPEEVMDTKLTVCDGYSRLTQALLQSQGIPAVRISGSADGLNGWEGHAWNMVYVDGHWIYMDTTWGSKSGSNSDIVDVTWFDPTNLCLSFNHNGATSHIDPNAYGGDDTPGKITFTDVADGVYYSQPVTWAIEQGITSGTSKTTFSPDETCTTAQILTFLWRANGSPSSTESNPFSDVSADMYYADAAKWANEKGLVSGTAFNGDAPATRSATVTYLWKLAGSPSTPSTDFTDVAVESEYAQAVSWAVEKGVTNGTSDTTFSPDDTCTRGQIVTFLYRAFA